MIGMKSVYLVRQYKDSDGCFILRERDARGLVPFYSSISPSSISPMRHGEAEYRTLVEGTVPATVEQTAAELDNYALAVGGPDKVPADWPAKGLAWPFQLRRSRAVLYPEVMLYDVRTNQLIVACFGFAVGTDEITKFAHALQAAWAARLPNRSPQQSQWGE